MKEMTDELPLVTTSPPQKPNVPSFPFRFLVTTLLYILLVLFPIHVGFGVDVKQMWAIILPTVIFGLIFSKGVTK